MLLFLSFKLYSNDFPKVLHFIWLGGAPHSADELNKIRDNGNKSFLKFTQNLQPSMKQVLDYFKQTFNQDNVQIKALEDFWDLLMQEKDKSGKDKFFLDEHTKSNLITSFNDEINIKSPQGAINLAAASDYYGGIYFDFDVYSTENYKLDIPANSVGFKIIGKCPDEAYKDFAKINNNLLASVDHGQIISIDEKMKKIYVGPNYQATISPLLSEEEKKLVGKINNFLGLTDKLPFDYLFSKQACSDHNFGIISRQKNY